MNGILIIDKPAGLTSHDVVNRLRRILNERSVGHLGTLDPSATGVLPMVVGNLTRLAQFYLKVEKVYEGTIRFGFATDTYDAEGEATSPPKSVIVSQPEVQQLAAAFLGVTQQVPPPYSAKKIQGVPAYKLARKNKEVSLPSVQVEVKEFEIISAENNRATFQVRVSSGTYIRSLAHEMGARLGCGAHLESLRRTECGEFTLNDSYTLDQVNSAATSGSTEQLFLHPRKLLPQMPCVTVNEEAAGYIRSGRTVNLPEFSTASQVKVFVSQQELICIARRIAGTLFHPKIVFSSAPTLHIASKS